MVCRSLDLWGIIFFLIQYLSRQGRIKLQKCSDGVGKCIEVPKDVIFDLFKTISNLKNAFNGPLKVGRQKRAARTMPVTVRRYCKTECRNKRRKRACVRKCKKEKRNGGTKIKKQTGRRQGRFDLIGVMINQNQVP